MITSVVANNLQDGFFRVLGELKTNSKTVDIGYQNVGGVITKELHPCIIEITDPLRRTLLYPKRGNNPFATLAETLWVMAGRNDVAWLEKFLPRAKDFSDDGKVWRAGYGPRLRKWPAPDIYMTDDGINYDPYFVDQLQFIVKQLLKNPMSRQAVASIWDPTIECKVEQTKDWPCSNWLHFMIRDNKLDLTVTMRSNDIIWGWSAVNVYEFTAIQEIIAEILNVRVGSYYHLSDSMHIYQKDFERMENLIQSWIPYEENFKSLPVFRFMGESNIDFSGGPIAKLQAYFEDVENLCEHLINVKNPFMSRFPVLFNTLNLLELWLENIGNEGEWKNYNQKMMRVSFSDLKVACDYWYRKNILHEKDGGADMIRECITRCA